VEVRDLRAAIDEVRPDALIVDANLQGGAAVAEASGLPWCQYSPFPPVFESKDAPPYGPGLRPARGPLGHARDSALYSILRPLADHYLPPVNALRGRLGLDALRHLEEVFLRSHRFVLFTAEPLEYPRSDRPASVRLVGPLIWEPPASPPVWLEEETRPVVLVTASTVYQRDDKLIATALEALAGENVAVIATTGALNSDSFNPPENARVEAFVRHAPVLERAACVVSHGGMGITLKALAAGVPMCVVPFWRDQFEVARRVEVAKAGTRLHHKRLTPKRLREAVRATIRMRGGAQSVAAAFARAGGAHAAADAVEELLPSRLDLRQSDDPSQGHGHPAGAGATAGGAGTGSVTLRAARSK
jgi:MGT family glycosyltransferase